MKNINEVILNPARMRIIQALALKETATANELCESISDIPRATLYRHIKILVDHDIVTIVSEERIRGSIERTLSLNHNRLKEDNTIEKAADNAFGFLMSTYSKFHQYFSNENPNPGRDKVFLNNTVLLMSDREFDAFLEDLKDLLLKYSYDENEGRRPRDLSIISAPVEN